MEEWNGKIEWKYTKWKNRMEMVEMVDCNGYEGFRSNVLLYAQMLSGAH